MKSRNLLITLVCVLCVMCSASNWKVSSYADLETAVSTIGSTPGTLEIDQAEVITDGTTVTIPATMCLEFTRAGSVDGTSGGSAETLTFADGATIKAPWNNHIFLSNVRDNVTFNNGVVEVHPEWFGIDGTSDEDEINMAMDSIDHGTCRLNGEKYVTDGYVAVDPNIYLIGRGELSTQIEYSGSDYAVYMWNSAHARIENIWLQCTHDAGGGIKFGNDSDQCVIRNMYINNDGAASVTAKGIYLRGNGAGIISIGLNLNNVVIQSFKYGIYGETSGVNGVTFINVGISGYGAGPISGSYGIYMDNYIGMGGTSWHGGWIESFDKGVYFPDGTDGFSIHSHFEGNTTNYDVGDQFNGIIRSDNGGWYYQQGTNAGVNEWYSVLHDEGYYARSGRYNHEVISTHGNKWEFKVGSTETNGHPFPQGGFYGNGGHTNAGSPSQAYIFSRDHKLSWGTAAPTAGSWKQGDIVVDDNASSGQPVIRHCYHSGTFDSTSYTDPDTTNGSPVISGFATTAGISFGEFIDVSAGFSSTGPFKVLEVTSTTVRVDTNANSTQTNVTVDTSPSLWEVLVSRP